MFIVSGVGAEAAKYDEFDLDMNDLPSAD